MGGKLAFEQTKEYIASTLVNNDNDELIDTEQPQKQLFGLFIGDNDNKNNNDQFGNKQNNLNKEMDLNKSSLFEKIENLDFNAIYQCIHIHETLGTMDGFVTRYTDLRKRERNKILAQNLIIWIK